MIFCGLLSIIENVVTTAIRSCSSHLLSISKQLSRVTNSLLLLLLYNICSYKSPRDDLGGCHTAQKTTFPQPETEADRISRASQTNILVRLAKIFLENCRTCLNISRPISGLSSETIMYKLLRVKIVISSWEIWARFSSSSKSGHNARQSTADMSLSYFGPQLTILPFVLVTPSPASAA